MKRDYKCMRLSIVIVAYINYKDLQRTLDSISLFNDIGNELEVIIVDNSPMDQRVNIKLNNNDWNFKYKYIPSKNRGFGAGNNIGEEHASGEIIGFVNPDIILIQPIFQKIISEFENDPQMVMAGCRLLKENRKINSSFKYVFGYGIIKKQLNKLVNILGIFNDKKMYIEGADIFIRKSTFDKVGRFDEQFFMYYEEADLMKRINTITGARVKFLRNVELVHLENGSTPNSENAVRIEIDSCRKFATKYGLDANRKIKADYRYLKLKSFVNRFIRNELGYENQLEVYRKEM